MRSSPRRAKTLTRTTGTTSSVRPRPKPRCVATALRSTRSVSGRECCATSPMWTRPLRRLDAGCEFQAALDWRTVKRIKSKFNIPLGLKGIATVEDARVALDHGVDWIYVSNHGGRQLDHGRGSMDVLPEIVEAVAGRAGIIVDGGFARGTDVVKAMAAGANLVGLGRMQCYALAAGGEKALVRMLEILEDEVQRCLGLLGVTNFAELDRSYLHAAPPVTTPHVFSAFPLLKIDDYRY